MNGLNEYEIMKFFARLVKLRKILDDYRSKFNILPTELEDTLDLLYYQIKDMEVEGGLSEEVDAFLENKKRAEKSFAGDNMLDYFSSNDNFIDNRFEVMEDDDFLEINTKYDDFNLVQKLKAGQEKELNELWYGYIDLLTSDVEGGSGSYVLHGVQVDEVILVNHESGIKGWLSSFREKYFSYILSNYRFDKDDLLNYKYNGKNVFFADNNNENELVTGITMKKVTSLSNLVDIILDINEMLGIEDSVIIVNKI